MTLLELLLVLTLLAVVASFAWIAVKPLMAHQRLRTAADAVRSELARGRANAMKSAHTYALRCSGQGREFRLDCDNGGDAFEVEAAESAGENDARNITGRKVEAKKDTAETDEEPLPPSESCSLPKGVTFAAVSVSSKSDDGKDQSTAETSGSGWASPILFYPDGSTSDAKITLKGDGEATVKLSLRGVTGTVSEGEEKESGEQ
jgi:hypothetical protein